MKKILIVYQTDNWKKDGPIQDPKYAEVAILQDDCFGRENVVLYHASIHWYKKGLFARAWHYENGLWQRVHDIVPDMVWIKMTIADKYLMKLTEIESRYKMLNSLCFEKLNNKETTADLFAKWSPKTIKVFSTHEIKKVFDIIKSKKLVLKPLVGSGGRDVRIIEKTDKLRFSYKQDFIAQEFIDTKNGIEGICKGHHDLRLVFLGNKLMFSYVRQPARGSLLANLAQGGKMFLVSTRKLPRSLMKVVKQMLQVIEHFDAGYYTLDFFFDKNQKPYFIEMNTKPGGYFNPEERPFQVKFFRRLGSFIRKQSA
jgi:glutathione synthase/RimK-type ligase-like ATP-grasp enzyme